MSEDAHELHAAQLARELAEQDALREEYDHAARMFRYWVGLNLGREDGPLAVYLCNEVTVMPLDTGMYRVDLADAWSPAGGSGNRMVRSVQAACRYYVIEEFSRDDSGFSPEDITG